jgi:hypothetical protein
VFRQAKFRQALGSVLQQIAEMTLKIKQYDRQIQLLTQTEYPETQALLKVLYHRSHLWPYSGQQGTLRAKS